MQLAVTCQALWWVLAMAGVAACYQPRAQNCSIRCGVGDACPDGSSCSNGLCTTGGVCSAMMPPGETCRSCDACSADFPVCVDGACRACGGAGSLRCRDGCVETCDGAAGWWASPVACKPCAPPPPRRILATGWRHGCAVWDGARDPARAGQIKCWGGNDRGQLGLGDIVGRGATDKDLGARLPFLQLGDGRAVVDLAVGGRHTCVLLHGGEIKCWGDNGRGQLGLADVVDRGVAAMDMGDALAPIDLGRNRSAVALSAGGRHSCAVLDNGVVKCWGDNGLRQLGVDGDDARGDAPCEMGDALPAVDLGGRRATAVAAGDSHSCALVLGGEVFCWGNGERGQLGDGTVTMEEIGLLPRRVDFGPTSAPVVALAAGAMHTCALLQDGALLCWGESRVGQIGYGGDSDSIHSDPSLLPPVDVGGTVVAVVAGSHHTCALLDHGRVKCWGLNNFGQLGLGDSLLRGRALGEVASLSDVDLGRDAGGAPLRATALAAAASHTCAALEDGRIKCWGENASGQLGIGATDSRGDRENEMGDALPAVMLDGSSVP